MKKTSVMSISILCLLMMTGNAYAYIDAGSGSYVIQLIAGAFLGTVFTFKMYYKKFFSKKRNDAMVKTEDAGNEPARPPSAKN